MQTTPPEFERQLRSLFAVLRTLVRQTVAGRESIEDYAAHLEGRIGCLARAHAMVLRAPEEGVDLHELICGEFLAQAVREEHFKLTGPEIRIGREATAAIALTFHELTMNALSHGALDKSRGSVDVSWSTAGQNGEECLYLGWRESGAALSKLAPRHRGFGFELLERMLSYELSARPRIQFTPEGAHIELYIPTRAEPRIWRTPAHR
jgi:two-component system CheB/CheR fusion protein